MNFRRDMLKESNQSPKTACYNNSVYMNARNNSILKKQKVETCQGLEEEM